MKPKSDKKADTPEAPGVAQLAELLQFHIDCGCDEVLATTPIQRLSEPPPPQAKPAQAMAHTASMVQTKGIARPHTAAPSIATHVAQAEALAQSATTLEALRHTLETFEALPIKAQAHNTVFCDGEPKADIMLVGEAPGRDEDLQGKPFVGQSGRLLDLMLAALGLSRDKNIYIANCLPWRPPGNRTPTKDELAIMAPFMRRHIVLKAPRWLVCVGGVASNVLIDAQQTLGRLRGRWHEYRDGSFQCPVFAVYHPAWVLRRPDQKKTVWQDWLCFWARVQEERAHDKGTDKGTDKAADNATSK